MKERDVRRALRRVGLGEPAVVTPILGGWANWTFDLDGTTIVRFPRNDSVALATHRELSLLPELAAAVAGVFEVPTPTHVATWRDRPFFAYPRLDGTPLPAADDRSTAAAPRLLGEALSALHAFPVERAAHLLRLGPPESVWRHRYEDLWEVVAGVALPEMDTALADEVRRRYHQLLDDPPAFPPCLIHNDLGPEHVLLRPHDPPVALLDFEDASVGDPAVDLTPLVAFLGADGLPALVAGRDLGDRLPERLSFYRWMGSVHAVIYGVTEGVEEERTGGLAELRRRLATPLVADLP